MIKIIRTYITSLKKKYFEWRYWGHLYREMAKQVGNGNRKAEKEQISYINKPGIAFSFDDSYRVHDWYKYGANLFGYYDVKVTFNINGVHPLESEREHTQLEIDKLLELQANGHEIGHHSFTHQAAVKYTKAHGYKQWIKDEIETLLQWMEKQSHSKTKERFKKPVSFVFPHFDYNKEMVNMLTPKFFKLVRGHLKKDNLTSFNHSGFAPSICLDGYYSCNPYYIKKIIKLTKKTGRNLILTCHSILPDDIKVDYLKGDAEKWASWRISPKLIQEIINEAKKQNIEFYTTAEIAGIATFIDHNFEETVRDLISKQVGWIEIAELMKVKELDLSNKGISNLAGLEYFLNLEILNISNNPISDFRLLKKLPKLKHVIVENSNQSDPSEIVKDYSLILKSSILLLAVKIVSIMKFISFLESS